MPRLRTPAHRSSRSGAAATALALVSAAYLLVLMVRQKQR